MPHGNFETVWLQPNLNKHAQGQALQAIEQTGRALPCQVTAVDGALVTVKFLVTSPQTLAPLTLPRAESQWLRAPVQIGDFGFTVPADTYLGQISGQGGGQADTSVDYGNLSTLVFVPVASVNFPATPDPNKAWVNGPNGAELSDADKTVSVTCDKATGQVTITAGGISMIVDKASGTVQIGGSGTGSGDSLMRVSDVQAALNTLATNLKTWANANFQSGTNSAPVPTVPTVSGSPKTFSA
jgi:hypothetical protein